MKALLFILLLLISSCSDKNILMESTYPELSGRYTDPNNHNHYWEFDDTNIAIFRYSANELDYYQMQWKIKDHLFYSRNWRGEGKWRMNTWYLEGDSLEIAEYKYVKN